MATTFSPFAISPGQDMSQLVQNKIMVYFMFLGTTIAGNYRPISLLSIHYKLASCAITQRIKPAVNIVVGRQQKAYVEGNVIGSCIINLLNMMHNVNEQKKASLILLIDFRKAFDSIDHNFITTVLTELGFLGNIVKWISILFIQLHIQKSSTEKSSAPHGLTIVKGSVYAAFTRKFVAFALEDQKAKDLFEWSKDTYR